MKRKRLWWIAGALVFAVAAVGWWLVPSSGAPRVSLGLVGYTNRVMRSGPGSEWSGPVALVGVTNHGRVPVELRMSLVPQGSARDGGLVLPPQVLVAGLICSSVTNFPGEPLVLGMMVPALVPAHQVGWWTELRYEALSPGERLRRWLLRFPLATVRGWAARSLPVPAVHRVRFGPITNVPPGGWPADPVQARLDALSSLSTNAAAWRAMARTNGLLLGTNKPPAEGNPGGGLKRLEF